MKDKIKSLSKFLNIDKDEIEKINKKYYKTNGYGNYLVLSNKEAEKMWKDKIYNFIYDYGIDFLENKYIDDLIEKYANQNYFYKLFIKSVASVINDEYKENLEELFNEYNTKDKNELVRKIVKEKYGDNYVKSYKNLFGKEDLYDLLENDIDTMNWEEIFDFIKNEDSRGALLSDFDGEENKKGNYYIYRIK